jgi:hypothetical protein
MHHPKICSRLSPSHCPFDTGSCRNPGTMSPDTRIDELRTQVASLTEQLRALLGAATPPRMVLTVPELAFRWSLSIETVRRMIRRGELATVRNQAPYAIALAEVYRFESGSRTATKLRKRGAA